MTAFGNPDYGLTTTLPGVDFDDAITRTTEALSAQGFGVLTTIDVQATLKKKLSVDFDKYTILGACNPSLAHQALQAEGAIGLLLPCNVVVAEDDSGQVVVSALDPVQLFGVVGRDDIEPLAQQVREELATVIDELAG